MVNLETIKEMLGKYNAIKEVTEAIHDIEKIDKVLSGNANNHERERLITNIMNKYKKKFNDMFLEEMPEIITQINEYIRLNIKKVGIISILLWLNNWLNTVRNIIIIYACLLIEKENGKEFSVDTKNKPDFGTLNVNIVQQMVEQLAINCLNNIK